MCIDKNGAMEIMFHSAVHCTTIEKSARSNLLNDCLIFLYLTLHSLRCFIFTPESNLFTCLIPDLPCSEPDFCRKRAV